MRGGEPPRHVGCGPSGTAGVRDPVVQVERAGEVLARVDDGASAAIATALESARRHDAWEIDHRTDKVVHGLGLAHLPRRRTAADLSGGQLSRLSLAWTLLRTPDTLLLDEPTNHLSLLLVSELELGLPDFPGAVVVASHDRWLREDWVGERLELPGETLER